MGEYANLIGRAVARLRYQREWTQDQLVAKMQVRGCCITRDVLANVETRRSSVTDKQIEHFAAVFRVRIDELFVGCYGEQSEVAHRGFEPPWSVGHCGEK